MEADTSPDTLLRHLEEQLLHPKVRSSAQDVAALLTEDFLEFGSSGCIFTKQQIIESLLQEVLTRRTLSDFRTKMLAPGVALVTYRAVRQDEVEEQEACSLRSSIWRWEEGRWQMVFHQGTPARIK